MKDQIKSLLQNTYLPSDSEDERLKKSTLVVMALPFGFAGLLWGALYFMNGLALPGCIPSAYGILSLTSVVHFFLTKKFRFFRFSQILLILLLPFFLQVSLGGFIPSSTVILWAVISPLGALVFYDVRQSIAWFVAFVALVTISFFIDDLIPRLFHWNISEKFILGMFLMNVAGVSGMIYMIQYYFVGKQMKLKKSIEEKNTEILTKNKEITDSINYARRIQYALLAHEEFLRDNLPGHFVLFRPKDIVSGDFYWAAKKENVFYMAVCDSTGHGVPGAFMSLLNISFLNEAINEKQITEPGRICDYVREKLIGNLSRDGSKDGMDGVLMKFDGAGRVKIDYAAAHNAPILVRDKTLVDLSFDKMPIGMGEKHDLFGQWTIDLQKNDMLYLFTDGFADQFGGPKGKKFKYKQFEETLLRISSHSLPEQKEMLNDTFDRWKGDLEQVDDVLVIGIRV